MSQSPTERLAVFELATFPLKCNAIDWKMQGRLQQFEKSKCFKDGTK